MKPTTIEICDYLRSHLKEVLKSNNDGQGGPVSFHKSDEGGIYHQLGISNNGVAGSMPPSMALYEDAVFKPKKQEVLQYLEKLGISQDEAKSIIDCIGLKP